MRHIIYIDRNYLYFYGAPLKSPIALQFLPTTVKDMELINYQELEKQIDNIIKTNKILPDDTGIVVAHQSSFEKVIDSKIIGVELETAKKTFVDTVPFEEVIYREFPTAKGLRLIAVNKELIYAIKDIFQERGFRIVTITSIAAIYPDSDVPFNLSTAQEFFKRSQTLAQMTFPVEDIEAPITDVFDEGNKPVPNNNRLFLMIGVFIVLFGALAVMLILRNRESATVSKVTPTLAPQATPTQAPVEVSPTKIATASPSIDPSVKTRTTIQILNGSGLAGQADQLKKTLEDGGYTNTTTGNAQTLDSDHSLVVFKPDVAQEVRKDLTTAISSILGEVTVQENANITSEVVITTARTNTSQPTPTP